jgi:hypothetical protein
MFLVHEMMGNFSKVVMTCETEREAIRYLQGKCDKEAMVDEDDFLNYLSHFSIEDDGRELIYEDTLSKMYDDMLNECYPEMFGICASIILYRADKTQYDCGLNDYYDSIRDSYYCEGME